MLFFSSKKAFNLGEIMIAVLLIGIISVLGIQTVNRASNDYTKMYSTAFNTLLQAAGNCALNWQPTCQCSRTSMLNADAQLREVCWSEACWNEFEADPNATGNSVFVDGAGNITGTIRRDYPGYLLGNPIMGDFNGFYTDENFCKLLVANLNTINQKNECIFFINSYATSGLNYGVGIDFNRAFCSTIYKAHTDASGDDISLNEDYANRIELANCENEIQPSFVTANGQKFYISRLLSVNANDDAFLRQQNRMFFRLVVVDLNGDAGPNTQLQKGSTAQEGKLPDMVMFALRADGTVVPLGRPEFSRNYINAQVQYPEFKKGYDAAGNLVKNEKRVSESYTLHNAKAKAWGVQIGTGGTVDDTRYGQIFSPLEPFTYSHLLYSRAASCRGTGNWKGCTNDETNYMDELFARLVSQFVMNRAGEKDTIIQDPSSPNADVEHGCTYRYSRCKIDLLAN